MYYEIYQDHKPEWRSRLRAGNGRIIADSGEGYQRVSDCEAGIELVNHTNAATPVRRPYPHNALAAMLGVTAGGRR